MNKTKIIGTYTGIMGAAYIIYGVLEMIAWFYGELNFPLYPTPDIFAGFVLIVIGSLLLYNINYLIRMKYEGLSFLFVGLVLSTIIGVLYLLIMGADALDAAVVGEPWEFDASSYNLPAILFFLLLTPGWMIIKERGKFEE